MSRRENRELAQHFDRLARKGFMREFSPEESARVRKLLAAWGIRRGERVLEPGCGSGRLTEHLARAVGPDGEVLAFDVSPEMTAMARQRSYAGAVQVIEADGAAIPRPSGHFGKVICFQVFPHLVAAAAVLAEFHRALKPGGDLWINHLASREAVNRIHREAGPPVAGHLLPGEGEWEGLLAGAGFHLRALSDTDEGFSVHAARSTT